MDIPESSDSESISSIVIPQRKLFTEKENNLQKKFGPILGTRRSSAKLHKTTDYDKTVNVAPKNLFSQASKAKSKPVFPAELLTISPEKVANKTKEIAAAEVKVQVRPLFGNRAGTKRKNMFIDFIVSESEDEISEIQPRVFGFQKKSDQQPESSNTQRRDPSPTSSINTDVEMDEWKHLPSSTMVEIQLEDMMSGKTPVKKAKLSKLSTNNTSINKTKQSNKEKSLNSSKGLTHNQSKDHEVHQNRFKSYGLNLLTEDADIIDINVDNQEQVIKEIQGKVTEHVENYNSENKSITGTHENKSISNKINNQTITPQNINSSFNNKKLNKSISSLKQTEDTDSVKSNTSLNKKNPLNKSNTLNKSVKLNDIDIDTSPTKKATNTSINRTKNLNKSKTSNEIVNLIALEGNVNQSVNMQQKSMTEKQIDEQGSKDTSVASQKHSRVISESETKSPSREENQHEVEGENEEDLSLRYESEEDNENEVNVSTEKSIFNDEVLADSNKTSSKKENKSQDKPRDNSEEVNHDNKPQDEIQNESYIEDNGDIQNEEEMNAVMEASKNENDQDSKEEPNESQEQVKEEKLKLNEQSKEKNRDVSVEKLKVAEEQNQEKDEISQEEQEQTEEEHDINKEEQVETEEHEISQEIQKLIEEDQSEEEPEESEEEQEESVEEQEQSEDEKEQSVEEQEESVEVQKQSEEEQEQSEDEKDQSVEEQEESVEVEEQSEEEQELSEDEKDQSVEEQDESVEVQKQSEEEQEQSEDEQEQSEDEQEQGEEELEESVEVQVQSRVEQEESVEEQEQSEEEQDQSEAEQSEEEQPQSEEEQEDSQNELEESQEVEPVDSSAVIEDSNENNAQNDGDIDMENDDEENELANTETPNLSHDTTGRHRTKENSKAKSPEAVLHDKTKQMESFMAKGRNTSLRRTSIMKSMNIRASLAPTRESTGLSDGTSNSSAEGSGWDSHRTTRKTLRQTFGKDFSPRKSLRALVLEKSAKRQTAVTDITSVTSKFPQANSTELPEASNFDENDYPAESNHDVSKRTRQTTLELYLQKIKKQNLEKKLKMEEAVRNSLKAPPKDITNVFKVPARPPFPARKSATKQAQTKPKARQMKSNLICFDDLPDEVKEDMKYKPPKRFQPNDAAWITKRLYKSLETKLEAKYDYKARVRAEKLVQTIYQFTRELKRREVAPSDSVDVLKHEMARLDIVKTHFEFYQFFREYMPREIRIKVIPDIVNKIQMPRQGIFSDILRGNTIHE